ncbi:AcrR family transcriptional regulator [Polynucleobacter sphagniphilus]|jgi:AcrR family transcriptional regulator|nr:AcrR family transcriptional regulator [Polynucleobacter sphagniphilus]MDH6241372.1 AcrR family transcriptional regulator [Polynucleobacter sphagniphilus]MDH6300323.1 AcrR family transcriptional regulator [Polynucleobacter sphagniphilus]
MYNLSMEQLVISPRNLRQQALADAKRQHILNAAKAVFMEFGLDAVSMREIAKRAGYTAGAIYSYFASKEDIYAALLTDSLERLNDCVSQSTQGASIDQKVDAKNTILELRKSALAFYQFYRDNPRDLDLGFYLFQGLQPRGLSGTWDQALNKRLRDAMHPQEIALTKLGFGKKEIDTELTAIFAHIVGVLLLNHTGRIRMFGKGADELINHYLDQLALRLPKNK